MSFWIIAAAANLLIGACVGLTGVAGFLLPILYTGPLAFGVTEGLALSFAAFILSGILGSVNYQKAGNMDIPFGIRLGIGSLLGSVIGVKLNLVIPEAQAKVILYVVVFLSGCSILLRKESGAQSTRGNYRISDHLFATLLLGFVTGGICALSGAGGPILVMPLLTVLGMNIRTAVGVALFDSIFIGIPACIGYLSQCDIKTLLPVMTVALFFHAAGVLFGSRNAGKINQRILKKGVAVFSVVIAVWKLRGILFTLYAG